MLQSLLDPTSSPVPPSISTSGQLSDDAVYACVGVTQRVLQREMCVLITHIAFTPEDYLIMSQYEVRLTIKQPSATHSHIDTHFHIFCPSPMQGLELILKALENHRASRPLVASALRMLWKFSTASLELRDRLRSYGGLALMLNLLTVIPQQSVRYV